MSGRVLVVDDHVASAETLAEALSDAGHAARVAHSGEAALGLLRAGPFDAVVTDLRMAGMDGIELIREIAGIDPELPVLLLTAYATIERAVQATRAGAFCFLTKPVRAAEVETHVRNAVALRRARAGQRSAQDDAIVGRSTAFLHALGLADRAARSDASVLVTGETGTGKELFARRIHARSPRASGPLISVNAAAIPESLIEGELFGHARGAFTGAVAERAGLFEEAHRGTLFLDEIGELAPAAQSRLLRVLQEGVVRRVGENRDRSVDVRIVAATHRNLASGTDFRRDLFFRLNVLPIELPPLRSRGDDVLLLFGHALTRACRKAERPVPNLSSEAIERLRRYRWPGNVRELQNVAERIAIFGPPGHVAVEDLPSEVQEVPELPGAPDIPPGDFDLTAYLEQVEEAVLRRTLLRHDGVKARAAASLGMERNSFRYKLKKYGIEE